MKRNGRMRSNERKTMKKLTRIAAVLMILVMTFALVGCGDDSKALIGKWGMKYDMHDAVLEQMGDEFADFKSSLEVTIFFEFKEDGTMEMSVDNDEFAANYANWLDDFSDYAANYIYDSNPDYSKEDIDAVYSPNVKEYIKSMMEESVKPEDVTADMHQEGVWEAKKGKIFISDGDTVDQTSYDLYTISGDTLTFELPKGAEADGENMLPGMEYPLVFTKVK